MPPCNREALTEDIRIGLVWAVAALFVYTGVVKILHLDAFAQTLRVDWLLPEGFLIPLVAFLIPIAEVVGGLAPLWPRTRRWGMATLLALCLVFTAAIAIALIRGLDVPCGCGLPGGLAQISAAHLALTLALGVILLMGSVPNRH